MKADKYLKTLTKRIRNSRIREEILREYRNHIEDCKGALMESGMSEVAAEEEAVRQMGDPAEAGQEMNRLYREGLDLGMTLWFLGVAILLLPLRWIGQEEQKVFSFLRGQQSILLNAYSFNLLKS